MAEQTQDDLKTQKVQKWTRAGIVAFAASIILGYIFLFQELFLAPPLFPWSIPIYLFGWLVVLILWVGLTPAKTTLLWLIAPGLVTSFFAFIIFAPRGDYIAHITYIGSNAHKYCVSLSTTDKHRLVCDGSAGWGSEQFYFYGGPKYSPFVKPIKNGVPVWEGLDEVDFSDKMDSSNEVDLNKYYPIQINP